VESDAQSDMKYLTYMATRKNDTESDSENITENVREKVLEWFMHKCYGKYVMECVKVTYVHCVIE